MTYLRHMMRHPVLHFILLGLVVFVLDRAVNPPEGPDRTDLTIIVSQADQDSIRAGFVATWQRPPDRAELDQLIEQHIRRQVLIRTALASGLDEEDPIIDQRLHQKMEALLQASVAARIPDEAELAAYLATQSERYLTPARISFEHVFLGRAPDPVRVAQVLADLRAGRSPAPMAMQTMLPVRYDEVQASALSRQFGSAFVAALPQDRSDWTGPVASAFGVHAVRVDMVTPAHVPPLEDIRDRVLSDWQAEEVQRLANAAYLELRDGFDVYVSGSGS